MVMIERLERLRCVVYYKVPYEISNDSGVSTLRARNVRQLVSCVAAKTIDDNDSYRLSEFEHSRARRSRSGSAGTAFTGRENHDCCPLIMRAERSHPKTFDLYIILMTSPKAATQARQKPVSDL